MFGFALWAGLAYGREPCPPPPGGRVSSRDDLAQSALRAFEGYRAKDVLVVDSSRCELEAGLRELTEELGPADAWRIHLAYALAAQLTGEDPAVVRGYVAAARASDAHLGQGVGGFIGEDDPVAVMYRAASPDADAGRLLPAPWSGTLRVNGRRTPLAPPGPHVLQVVRQGAHATQTFYREPGDASLRYVRRRPVIAGLMLGSAAASGALLAIGAATHGQDTAWGPTAGEGWTGQQLLDDQAAWEREHTSLKRVNNVALTAAGGLALTSLGLGVWYVTTF